MIPNTDINCGRCATPMYSDCVMWSGGNLSCVTLLQDCCDTSLTTVVTSIGNYMCSITNTGNYTIPVCMESFSITDFVGMQNAMMELICNSAVGDLTFGCIPSGTTTTEIFQNIIDTVNDQTIAYDETVFTVTGTTCADRGLTIAQPCWTAGTERAFSGEWRYASVAGETNGLYYMLDVFGNVRLSGIITSNGLVSNGNLSATTFIKIIQLPTAITPSQSSIGNHFVCHGYVASGSTFPTITSSNNFVRVDYNGANTVDVSRNVILHGKVDSSGWLWIEIPYLNGHWNIWLHSISYNINGVC